MITLTHEPKQSFTNNVKRKVCLITLYKLLIEKVILRQVSAVELLGTLDVKSSCNACELNRIGCFGIWLFERKGRPLPDMRDPSKTIDEISKIVLPIIPSTLRYGGDMEIQEDIKQLLKLIRRCNHTLNPVTPLP